MDHLTQSVGPASLDDADARLLRQAFSLARYAKSRGNGPYGAVLTRGGSVMVEGENTEQEADGDFSCHAEMVLLRRAVKEFTTEQLQEMTLFASTEPCPMCAGAIAILGLKRLVFGAGSRSAASRTGSPLVMDCRDILSRLSPGTEVVGPALESEALDCL